MTTVTLDHIKTEHAKVAELIAAFEAQSKTRVLIIGARTIELKAGEHYAGPILNEDGEPSHDLILLPGEAEPCTWADAKKEAASAGGELPTRREQSLLFANLKGHFKDAYYWSCEAHASASCYAWYQGFINGLQHYDSSNNKLRARFVRRLEIQ